MSLPAYPAPSCRSVFERTANHLREVKLAIAHYARRMGIGSDPFSICSVFPQLKPFKPIIKQAKWFPVQIGEIGEQGTVGYWQGMIPERKDIVIHFTLMPVLAGEFSKFRAQFEFRLPIGYADQVLRHFNAQPWNEIFSNPSESIYRWNWAELALEIHVLRANRDTECNVVDLASRQKRQCEPLLSATGMTISIFSGPEEQNFKTFFELVRSSFSILRRLRDVR